MKTPFNTVLRGRKKLTALAALLFFTQISFAQLATWNAFGFTSYGPSPFNPATTASNVTVTGFVRGAGVGLSGGAASNAWGGVNWAGGATQDATFTITANSGYQVSLSSINLFYRRSGTGPATGTLQYAIDAGSYNTITSLAFTSTSGSGAAITGIALSAFTELQNVAAGSIIHLRILPTGGASTGTWYLYSGTSTSICFTLNGSVNPAPTCTAPTGLVASGITSSTATLDWDDMSGITGYEYVLDMSSTAPSGAGTAITAHTYNASGLMPSTTYYMHVRTNCGGSFSGWTTVAFTTTAAPTCAAPTGLTIASVNSTSVNINWDTETGVAGFEYVLDMNSTDPAGAGTSTTGTTFSDGLLTPSTIYYFHLRTNCGSGLFSSWVTASFTTNPACTDPTGLTVNSFNATSVSIGWDAAMGISDFEYVLDMNASAPTGAGAGTTANTFNDVILTPSTIYYFHLRKDCGSGDLSNWVTVSFTTNPPCTDPTSLSVDDFNASSANISWDSETGITGFEYVLDMNSSDPTGAGIATTGNTYSNTSLSASTTYYFHLRKNCGSGDFSNWITTSFTTNAPCADPTSLSVDGLTTTTADLSWDSETGITGFEYVLDMNSTDPTGAGTATTGNTYSDASLLSSTTYYFHLRKNCGSGDFSNWVTLTFTTEDVCADPTSLAASGIGTTSASVNWDSETGITGFEYVLDMNSSDPTGAGTATTGNTYNDASLAPSTTYYFHLRTHCSGSNYSGWVTITFTTLPVTTGIANIAGDNAYSVYPNPTNGQLNFVSSSTGGKLSLVDMSGKTVQTLTINSSNTTIDLSHLEAQVYQLVYTHGDSRKVFKVVKQ